MKSVQSILTYSPVELSFGTSGLRGLVTDMTDLECYINTSGFINFLLETSDIEPGSRIAVAGDLRSSTPRILKSVLQAIHDSGCEIIYQGKTPTPALAYYGLIHGLAVIMVSGSHIPDDRNGIKFYKKAGEVLKTDEPKIKNAVAKVRNDLYQQSPEDSLFDQTGSLKIPAKIPDEQTDASKEYLKRYTSLFDGQILTGKTIVVYQHSSLAADLLVEVLEYFGASVIPVDKSSKFIPIDTENVTIENQKYFKSLAIKYPESFAIVSADGDSDRPFVVDETGVFHRGDILGALTATFLKTKTVVVPISSSDAIDIYFKSMGVELLHTKIGSPYVIAGMQEFVRQKQFPTVGWEVNGGFLTGNDISLGKGLLKALPTRDAFLPIISILVSGAQQNRKVSELFADLPQRFSQAGLMDEFPVEISRGILEKYNKDSPAIRSSLSKIFGGNDGFGEILSINTLDGLRITFSSGDIAHIRPSGNAPQLRIYSVANTQQRADEIVELALASPSGLLILLGDSAS